MPKNTTSKNETSASINNAALNTEAPVIMDALIQAPEPLASPAGLQHVEIPAPQALPVEQAPAQPEAAVISIPEMPAENAPVIPGSLEPQQQFVQEQDQNTEAQPMPGARQQTQNQTPATPHVKSASLIEVESVLAENLTDMYRTMTPQEQLAFRKKGEETSLAIEKLVITFRATTRKVMSLILEWLKIIPRVNQYFLEQESKIKTDEILTLQKKLKREKKNRIDFQ